MERWSMSSRWYHRLAVITTAGICLLVVAGGVVRLTGSGLGCDDWPQCNSERFVDVSSGHTAIEQLNRLLSGLIGIPALLLAIGAFRPADRTVTGRKGPALGVLISVLANGVVGGIAVRNDLHPLLVQSHFLLAMVAISFGMVAVRRSGEQRISGLLQPTTVRLAVALGALTAGALATGTVVTGTGPHAGDEEVRRFGFDISSVARIHSVTVIVALITAIVFVVAMRRDRQAQPEIGGLLSGWIFLGVLQGGIGYVQYFNGVPEILVGAHIAGATALWVVTTRLVDRVVAIPGS